MIYALPIFVLRIEVVLVTNYKAICGLEMRCREGDEMNIT